MALRDDYKDNKEDYLKILDRMANENEFSELEKLFDSESHSVTYAAAA